MQTSRTNVNNNNNQPNHHHHHAYPPNHNHNHRHHQSQQANHRHSHPIPASAGIEHQDAPRRHTLTRGAVLLSGHSIRKSIRRLPRMVAQLTTGGRMGAYGASMNASDEFIVSKGTCSDGPQGKQQSEQLPGRGDGNAKIEDLVEGFGNGVSASELLIPLCMVSSCFVLIHPFVFVSCVQMFRSYLVQTMHYSGISLCLSIHPNISSEISIHFFGVVSVVFVFVLFKTCLFVCAPMFFVCVSPRKAFPCVLFCVLPLPHHFSRARQAPRALSLLPPNQSISPRVSNRHVSSAHVTFVIPRHKNCEES